jgi:hypothetical protein
MSETNGFRRTAIIAEIHAERDRQGAEWGGPEHDDTHNLAEWFDFIEHQDRQYMKFVRDHCEEQQETLFQAEARNRFIKIAALAIAAMESLDRKAELESR